MNAEFFEAIEDIEKEKGIPRGYMYEKIKQAMLAAFGEEANAYIEKRGEKYFVDNKALNKLWLTRAGLTQIDVSPDCTKCQPDRFWSHRVTRGERGSLAGIIKLQEEAPV